ncbi:MAG TPA: SsrA-binding protein SmpB [Dehalococcoidia bacterium]|nr:SsrA-binding protein SmpB [Dehalococcoidia bacterium]
MTRPTQTRERPRTDASKSARPTYKDVAVNRRASHDYEILERVEAGLSLTGSEIKSIRQGKVSLQEAYARPEHGEIWLHGAHIAEYGPAAQFGHQPRRPRRLLLHRAQVRELARQVEARGLTLVPMRMYLKDGLAKLEIALGKGRRQYDKREAIAKREANRDIERALRRNNR